MENIKQIDIDLSMNTDIKNLIEKINQNPDFSFVNKLYEKLPEAEIYLVGGSVRDAFFNRENKDFDFIVTGIKKTHLEKFLQKHGKVSDVDSRSFGVFKFRPYGYKEEAIDVALPRKERQQGLGYKDFSIETSSELSIDDDLSRRDFTMNALAINLKNGELIDKFNGIDDLKKGIIMAVGDPEERFSEDPSRILRAIRFTCQLNFKIEDKTWEAIKRIAPEITKMFIDKTGKGKQRVASETIVAEFLKGFDKNPVRLLNLYDEVGLLDLLLPEIKKLKGVEQPPEFHSEGDVWEHTTLTLKNLKKDSDINLKLAALFHDIGKPDTQKIPSDENDRIRFHEHDDKGAEIFVKIWQKMKLSSPFAKKNPLYVDKKEILWLVKNHMICVNQPETLRRGTLEKYFFKNPKWGKNLLSLSKADISATIPPSGRSDFSSYNILNKKIKEVKIIIEKENKESQAIKKNPPILDGHEIQKVFNVKQGAIVGRIKELLRYLQLEKRLKNKKDIIKNKAIILEACQRTKTVDEADDFFKNII